MIGKLMKLFGYTIYPVTVEFYATPLKRVYYVLATSEWRARIKGKKLAEDNKARVTCNVTIENALMDIKA